MAFDPPPEESPPAKFLLQLLVLLLQDGALSEGHAFSVLDGLQFLAEHGHFALQVHSAVAVSAAFPHVFVGPGRQGVHFVPQP